MKLQTRSQLTSQEARILGRLLLMQAIDPGAVGGRIRQARLEAGLTQDEFCHAVGVTLRTAQHWEHGDNVPYRKLAEIAEVLNRDSGWLLHGESDTDSDDEVTEKLSEVASRLDRIEQMLARQAELPAEPSDT